MAIGQKTKIAIGILAVVGVLCAWQGFRYWWYHGYSIGERTGTIRKISVKGEFKGAPAAAEPVTPVAMAAPRVAPALDADAANKVALYTKAADKGHGSAIVRVGRCHALGIGTVPLPERV